MPVPNRGSSCLILQADSTKILLDIGDGTARQLAKFGIDPAEIDAGVITHAHIDHSAGIFGLLFWMKLTERKNDFIIYAPEYLCDAFRTFLPYMRIRPETLPFRLIFRPLKNGIFFKNSSLSLTAAGNDHLNAGKQGEKFNENVYSFSIIITERNKKAIYSSDVRSLNHLRDYASNSPLLISETAHISMDSVLSFAEKFNIKKIALTHFPPDFNPDGKFDNSDRNVVLLNDGDILRI